MGYLGYKPADKPLTSADITDGIIVNADINSSAAIAYSKLNLGTSITNSDISASAAIAQSKIAGSFGKVLQVVHTTYQSQAVTTSATPADISGFSASITPASTSNKVLVLVSVQMGGVGNAYGYFLLLRGSTSLVVGNGASNSQVNTFISSGYIDGVAAMRGGSNSYLDSPSTTSSTTYKIQFASANSSNSFYINRQSSTDNGGYVQFPVSSITLLEIAA